MLNMINDFIRVAIYLLQLVKRILRQTFEMCKRQSWNEEWVTGVVNVIEEILLDPRTCLGLNFHITEVFMEELAKVY
jgi:hypothetical protein